MSDDSQLVVPPSFVALYLEPGQIKPRASREEIQERHDYCEDMAQMLTGTASERRWDLGITEQDVLERIRRGLADPAVGLSPAEAVWVMRRLVELLGWEAPEMPTCSDRVR